MERFKKSYEVWFLHRASSLVIPPWSSVEGNLYWIRYTYSFALDVFRVLNDRFGSRPIKILDVGAGKGFLSFLCSYRPRTYVHAVDIAPNPFFLEFQKDHKMVNVSYRSFRDGRLPYPDALFDVIFLIEVIEHAKEPRRLVQECLRVLKHHGLLVITTPPRLRFLFRKDPHFRMRFLYLLPTALQNFIIETLLRYPNVNGYHDYKVHQILWNVNQFSALCKSTEYQTRITVDPPGARFSWRRVIVEKLPAGHSKK